MKYLKRFNENVDNNSIFELFENNDIDAIEEYIDNGGDLQVKDHLGRTLLYYAFYLEEDCEFEDCPYYYEIFEELLDKIDINITWNNGDCILFNVIFVPENHIEHFKMLLDRDVNLNRFDSDNDTIIDYFLWTEKEKLTDIDIKNIKSSFPRKYRKDKYWELSNDRKKIRFKIETLVKEEHPEKYKSFMKWYKTKEFNL